MTRAMNGPDLWRHSSAIIEASRLNDASQQQQKENSKEKKMIKRKPEKSHQIDTQIQWRQQKQTRKEKLRLRFDGLIEAATSPVTNSRIKRQSIEFNRETMTMSRFRNASVVWDGKFGLVLLLVNRCRDGSVWPAVGVDWEGGGGWVIGWPPRVNCMEHYELRCFQRIRIRCLFENRNKTKKNRWKIEINGSLSWYFVVFLFGALNVFVISERGCSLCSLKMIYEI